VSKDTKQRMKANPNDPPNSYHGREHDEDPTCHRTSANDTPCDPIDSPLVICDCCSGSGRIYSRHYGDGDGRECRKCNGKGSLDSPRSSTEQSKRASDLES